MGNRAVITLDNKTGIYLHWNGGRDSIEGFLQYCKLQKFRSDDYGMARLTQVIANFFGEGLSIGLGPLEELDTNNCDNGVYVVKDWEIIDRLYFEGEEQSEYKLFDMLKSIDEKQPEHMRLEKGRL